MLTVLSFMVAVLALLIVPGPTNTLLAASGAAIGVRKSLPLLPMALGGYLLAIGIWGHLIGPFAMRYHFFPAVSKLLASAYLAWSAVRLWRSAGEGLAAGAPAVPPRQVFLTTLLNPKALIFALVILPQTGLIAQLPDIGVFAAMVIGSGWVWIGIGGVIARSSRLGATPASLSRCAAMALGVFAVVLAGSVVGAGLG